MNLVAFLLATLNMSGAPVDFAVPRTCEQFAQLAYYQAEALQSELTPDAAYEETLGDCAATYGVDYHDTLPFCAE